MSSETMDVCGSDNHELGFWATIRGMREDGGPSTEAQVHFQENARTAVRRALFFTRLVEPDHTSEELKHALSRARDQISSVQVPGDKDTGSLSKGTGGGPPVDAPSRNRKYSGAYESSEQLRKRFRRLGQCLDHLLTKIEAGPEPEGGPRSSPYHLVQPLDKALCAFLDRSVPRQFAIQLVYVRVPSLLVVIRQHVGFLLAFVVALFLALGVEAVRSLILNLSALWLVGIVVSTLLPVVIDVWVGRVWRKRGKTPWWDRGGLAFLSMSPVTFPPQSWVPRQSTDLEGRRIYRGLVGKFAVYLLCWTAIGLVYMVGEAIADGDGVGLTTYMIVVTIELLVLVGAAVDFVDLHSQAPFRRWIAWGFVALALAVILSDQTAMVVGAVAAWLAVTWWIAHKVFYNQILVALRALTMVVVVGLLVTAFHRGRDVWRYAPPLAETQDEPIVWPYPGNLPVVVMAASGGGSRAAIYAALTLDSLGSRAELSPVQDNLHAISSVSGGSLTNAAYVASRLAARSAPDVPTCDGTVTARVRGDFLRPTLMGLITLQGRARGIERAWKECPVGLGDATIEQLGRLWRDGQESTPPFPLPLFNSVTLDRHAVAISPLEQRAFQQDPVDLSARGDNNAYDATRRLGQPTWVYYRSGIYGHRDLVGSYDPPLSSAVRASANFPFGFPLVEVATTAPLWYGPRENARSNEAKTVRMTDGGALSNSGMWSLYPLLANHHHVLAARGTLLIVVDASGMPAYKSENRQLQLIATIFDKNPKGEFVHREMLASLQENLGPCFAAVRITLPPTNETNIYTTWTLDDVKEAELEQIFASTWTETASKIRGAWQDLQLCVKSDPDAIERIAALNAADPRVPIS